MQGTIELSTENLLVNACRITEKVEKSATENLVKGETDKVLLLVSARQLSSIINQLKNQYDGGSQKANGQDGPNDYPDW